MLRTLLFSLLLALVSQSSFAQSKLLSEEELKDAIVYHNIDKALKKSGEVYILDLSSKGLEKLPKAVSRFRNLQTLILTDNQLTEFPPILARLKKLQTLYIDSNNIENLFLETSDPRSFKNLEYLYIGFNPIKSIPDNIKDIDLTLISLSGCKYLDLDKAFTPIAGIESLAELDLSYLNLDTIPWEVANLYDLTVLNLSANPSMEWDTSLHFLSQNKSLEELILQHNKLSGISAQLSKFKNLQSLDLSYNEQLSLNEVFSVTKNIKQLSSLYLSHCNIRNIPESIGDQVQLNDLFLDNNKIRIIPGSFGKLENLETLNLSHNEITDLPDEFGNLQSLENLILSHNPLENFPRNLENLTDLRYLELPKNSLDKETKKSIKKMFNKEVEIIYIK